MADTTIKDIAAALGVDPLGTADLIVTGVAEPGLAGPGDLAMAMAPKYADRLKDGKARAAVIGEGMDWQALGLEAAIVAPRPRYAMAGVTRAMDPGPKIAPGIHPTAIIPDSASIGAGAAIGPYVVIGEGVSVGVDAKIDAHVFIGQDAKIGDQATILAGVKIGHHVQIGDRVLIQMGASIGGDGFSFVTEDVSQMERARKSLGQDAGAGPDQSWHRIHSLGTLIIGDDVEIGCNSTIDRGTVAPTIIGNGTKLDNIVHVGHNCQIGADCLLCGMVGIAGSVSIGDRVVLGGRATINDNLSIGDDVVVAMSATILSNVPSGRTMMGYPAVKMDAHVEMYKHQRRLPRMAQAITDLQKAVSKPDERS